MILIFSIIALTIFFLICFFLTAILDEDKIAKVFTKIFSFFVCILIISVVFIRILIKPVTYIEETVYLSPESIEIIANHPETDFSCRLKTINNIYYNFDLKDLVKIRYTETKVPYIQKYRTVLEDFIFGKLNKNYFKNMESINYKLFIPYQEQIIYKIQ